MSRRGKTIRDADAEDEEENQYATGGNTLEDLDKEYPNRPKNHSRTLLFSEIFKHLFNPLIEKKVQPGNPRAKARSRVPSRQSQQEQRRNTIERFISRWRAEVGDDFYPALRLIIPGQDGDRGVYGLKESNIGKLLVKLMMIDKNSDDAQKVLQWKLPGQSRVNGMAGDFAGRCFEVLSKRPMRTEVGDMTIVDVNVMLDKLSAASGEGEQLPVFETFYQRMNPEELMWLIRIILKQMKIGATEKTLLNMWHPDAERLFNVSSSLRRVCWELFDPTFRLEEDETNITLMQCFQPQLADFQTSGTFSKMVDALIGAKRSEGSEYWIQEKLDGERMQLHMIEDKGIAGGKRFRFWSRKVKDYTYLYGEGFRDPRSALTRHLKDAFALGVRNIILDGEMITWDMEKDKILKFGTLKTAALSEQKKLYDESGNRPLFRVFDILYLNDQPLNRYTLRDRQNALDKAVLGVHRRLEIHGHIKAHSPDEIEPKLRKVIEESSEGLVLKNPDSVYSLNARNSDWIKVKPDYFNSYGENVDVVIIGGYYGSGRRGGGLSSFLCGLRVTDNDIANGANPEKCLAFLKVGGGFRAEDYAQIRHHTEGKWVDWDPKHPPTEYLELGGDRHQAEKPDVWIRPSDSVVIEVKGASAELTSSFATKYTLRFPRFKGLRLDRRWDSSLNWEQFLELKARVDGENKEKQMTQDSRRRAKKRVKTEVVITGQDAAPAVFDGPRTKLFEGLEFCVLTDSTQPKKTKTRLESLIKENGGNVSQRALTRGSMILIGEKKVVKVASLIKSDDEVTIVKPTWILDCITSKFLLPDEPGHLFHATAAKKALAQETVDKFGDSYVRDVDLTELRALLKDIPKKEDMDEPFNKHQFLSRLEEQGHDFGGLKGHLFKGLYVYFALSKDLDLVTALKMKNWIRFGGGRLAEHLDDESLTHVVVLANDEESERKMAADARSAVSGRRPVPNVVPMQWLEDCWKNSTLVDEQRYGL